MSFRAHRALTSSSHQDILHPSVKQPRWRAAPLNFRYWSSAGKGWIADTGSKMSCCPKWRSSCMSGSRSEGGDCLPPNLCSNPQPARSHRQPSKTNFHPKTTQSRAATPPCQHEPVEVFQASGQAATRMPPSGRCVGHVLWGALQTELGHVGEIICLGWPGNAVEFPKRSWWRGGPPCWS